MSAAVVRCDARSLPLPDSSVDLIVTSPPYFALRSYTDNGEHYGGQIGSEPTPAEFLTALWECTAECRRVLKPSGSLFVNLGDKYSQRVATRPSSHQDGLFPDRPELKPDWKRDRAAGLARMPAENLMDTVHGLRAPREKSLMGLPWRYAIGCIDGQAGEPWILRSEIVWSKPNGLPESVTDRVRRSHEQWFHFTKEPRYYSAVDEIRGRHSPVSVARSGRNRFAEDRSQDGVGSPNTVSPTQACNPLGKLPGSVWTIPTEPLTIPDSVREHYGLPDHWASFPQEWPRRIILGWSPSGVCVECGEGRRPVSGRECDECGGFRPANAHSCPACGYVNKAWRDDRMAEAGMAVDETGSTPGHATPRHPGNHKSRSVAGGYGCACPTPDAPTRPSVVLDPFGGTGTVAGVARMLGRTGLSFDASFDYSRLAAWRIFKSGHFAKATSRTDAERQGSLAM